MVRGLDPFFVDDVLTEVELQNSVHTVFNVMQIVHWVAQNDRSYAGLMRTGVIDIFPGITQVRRRAASVSPCPADVLRCRR